MVRRNGRTRRPVAATRRVSSVIDDALRLRLRSLIGEQADRVAGGDLTEAHPLEFIVRGEAVSARLYARYNRTVVLALDVFVDEVGLDVDPRVFRWVSTRSGVMPFAALRIDRPLVAGTAPSSVLVSHALVASSVDRDVLAEVLDGLTYMARRARGRLEELLRDDDASDDDTVVDYAGATDDDGDNDDEAADNDAGHRTDDTGTGSSKATSSIVQASDFTKHTAAVRSKDEVLAELAGLIGLGPVKEAVTALTSAQEIAEQRRAKGLQANTPSPHLVFIGNPGTGKTTVARLVGELYRAIGLLPSGHLVETDRAGLVAGYVGQTALKTQRVCQESLGGVLFIDEAYSLAGLDGHGSDYGHEAIDTLLTFMENHRGEMAVVVAGYPTEMKQFIDSNPGLRSRFDLFVPFPDYSDPQLTDILVGLATRKDYDFTPDALERAMSVIASWPRYPGFGNGRDVRILFNDITRRQAVLLAQRSASGSVSTDSLRTITVDAVPDPLPMSATTR